MAVFHIKASFGSRAGGQSARAKSDYIEREGRYEKDSEELEYKEHGNMPEWAEDDPGSYWEAADKYERSNGRLYSEIQFALPKELDDAGRRDVASDFAAQLTGPEKLPYTMAIHRGGAEGENPHAHLMYSERGQDGIERSSEQWFRRYNGKAPETGGARKSRLRPRPGTGWRTPARRGSRRRTRRWRVLAGRNGSTGAAWPSCGRKLTAIGDLERAAELSREPNVHLGPSRHREGSGAAVEEKLQKAERVERGNAANAAERDADRQEVARIEGEIRRAEARLKETYDRVRRAIDQRIQQAGRAIRAGSEAASAGRSSTWKNRCEQLAEQHADSEVGRYIEWSKTLGEHVTRLGEQVQQLAEQHADELKEYVGWSEHMGEQHGRLNAHVEKLTLAYNELARLLDES